LQPIFRAVEGARVQRVEPERAWGAGLDVNR
jgi:hypothetical protein